MAEDEELKSYFSPNGSLQPDVAAELRSIMRLHNLSAEDLYLKWDSYCLKMEIDAQAVTLQAIRNLKQTIQDSLEKDNTRRTHVKASATPRAGAAARSGGGVGGGDVFGMLDGLVPSTPAAGSKLRNNGSSASGLKRQATTPKSGLNSSPAARGMKDQLKSMDGTP